MRTVRKCSEINRSKPSYKGEVLIENSTPTYTDIFEAWLPYCLSIGMTEEQFWKGDPSLVQAYKQAQRLRDERKNQELWLQGLYFYKALSVVISNAFGGGKTARQKYFEEPIDLHPEETTARKQAEARQKVVDYLNAWKSAWDRKQGDINGIEDNS